MVEWRGASITKDANDLSKCFGGRKTDVGVRLFTAALRYISERCRYADRLCLDVSEGGRYGGREEMNVCSINLEINREEEVM